MKSTIFIFLILSLLSLSLASTTPHLSSLTSLDQLLIAGLRGLDGQTRGHQLSQFSGPVVESISLTLPPLPVDTGAESTHPGGALSHISSITSHHRVTVDDFALTLNTYNFLLIATKIEYLVKSRPYLTPLLFSFSQSLSLVNRFFAELDKKEPELRVTLDVRALKNLNMLIGSMDTRIIPIALVINLANVFNEDFMKFMEKENTHIFDLVNSFLPEIEKDLIDLSEIVESAKKEGEGKTDTAEGYELKFHSFGHVIQVVNPVIYQYGEGKAFLLQLPTSPYSPMKIPSSNLQQASALYDMLNVFTEELGDKDGDHLRQHHHHFHGSKNNHPPPHHDEEKDLI